MRDVFYVSWTIVALIIVLMLLRVTSGSGIKWRFDGQVHVLQLGKAANR